MIKIENIDPNPRKTGKHLYRVTINSVEVALFVHNREESLSKLLVLAANAVRIAEKAKKK